MLPLSLHKVEARLHEPAASTSFVTNDVDAATAVSQCVLGSTRQPAHQLALRTLREGSSRNKAVRVRAPDRARRLGRPCVRRADVDDRHQLPDATAQAAPAFSEGKRASPPGSDSMRAHNDR